MRIRLVFLASILIFLLFGVGGVKAQEMQIPVPTGRDRVLGSSKLENLLDGASPVESGPCRFFGEREMSYCEIYSLSDEGINFMVVFKHIPADHNLWMATRAGFIPKGMILNGSGRFFLFEVWKRPVWAL